MHVKSKSGISKRLYQAITYAFVLGSIFLIFQLISYLLLSMNSDAEFARMSRNRFKHLEDVEFDTGVKVNARFRRVAEKQKRHMGVIKKDQNLRKISGRNEDSKGKNQIEPYDFKGGNNKINAQDGNFQPIDGKDEMLMEQKKLIYKNRWQARSSHNKGDVKTKSVKSMEKIPGNVPCSNFSGLGTLHGQYVYYRREQTNSMLVVLGSSPKLKSEYIPNKDGNFQCIQSKETVDFSLVNDDFCDCEDGSDEPGTAACANTRFYCSQQVGVESLDSISSSRVRDGVCDCCDGSDELQLNTLHHKLSVHPFSGHCVNSCQKLLEQKSRNDDERRRALQRRQEYVQYAQQKQLVGVQEEFGKDGVWAYLDGKCLKHDQGEYVYEVCIFSRAQQKKKGGDKATFIIGKNGRWELDKEKTKYLRMSGGDGGGCPNGERETHVYFECGEENKLLVALEASPCIYRLNAVSPAACDVT